MRATEARLPLADAPSEGEHRVVTVGAHAVGLFRVDGALHALADRCPHRGAPLVSAGRTVRGVALAAGLPERGERAAHVRCPWHKWDFDIATGRCLVHPRMRVRRYAVQVEGDEIVVSLRRPSDA